MEEIDYESEEELFPPSSYNFVEYKDETELSHTYTQEELDVRNEFMDTVGTDGQSDELVYEPVEVVPKDSGVLGRQIGQTCPDFKQAFIKFIQEAGKIFFTIDPRDLIPLAVDLMDHYMYAHKGEKIPFDSTSGRSSTEYMNEVRSCPEVQLFLFSETNEDYDGEMIKKSPTPPAAFYKKIHPYITIFRLAPDRIFQVDLQIQKYLVCSKKTRAPWEYDYNPENDVQSITYHVCSDGEGRPFPTHVGKDYDFTMENFPEFLAQLKAHAEPSEKHPILLLMCRQLKVFSLNLLDMCKKDGIILCAFPYYSKQLEPLSQFIVPTIHEQFKLQYRAKYSKTECTSEEAISLMKEIISKVQSENMERTKRDFYRCLQLRECMTSPDTEAMTEAMEKDEKPLVIKEDEMIAGYDHENTAIVRALEKLKPKKRGPDVELNELMFAQTGPLNPSDFYRNY